MSADVWRHPWQVYRCHPTTHQMIRPVCSHRHEVVAGGCATWRTRLRRGAHYDTRPTPPHHTRTNT